jgi:hypothetical protein
MNQDEIRWLAGQFPHCPTIGLTTFSSNCLPICKVEYFCALSNKTLIQLPNIFYGSRNYIFLQINFNAFYAFWNYFVFLILVIHKFFEPKGSFTLKMDSDVHNSFISPQLCMNIKTLTALNGNWDSVELYCYSAYMPAWCGLRRVFFLLLNSTKNKYCLLQRTNRILIL